MEVDAVPDDQEPVVLSDARNQVVLAASLLAAMLAILPSCSSKSLRGEPMRQTSGIRFLALGDSYTIGESISPSGRWTVQLAAILRDQGIPIEDPTIIAKTGWTTDELAAAIDAAQPAGPFDLVTLLIGVNNQYRGRALEEYRDQLRDLIERSIGFAGGNARRVVVLSIPDWGVTPFAEGRDREKIAREIDAFNAVKREEAERAGAHFVDITPYSRKAAGDPGLTALDGLHPSGRMYTEWARLARPSAQSALAGGDQK